MRRFEYPRRIARILEHAKLDPRRGPTLRVTQRHLSARPWRIQRSAQHSHIAAVGARAHASDEKQEEIASGTIIPAGGQPHASDSKAPQLRQQPRAGWHCQAELQIRMVLKIASDTDTIDSRRDPQALEIARWADAGAQQHSG